jgi:hypothetical protein
VLGHRRWTEVGLEPLRQWDVALTSALSTTWTPLSR